VIAGVREAGLANPAIARATVGWLEVEPNSPNVIPGVVRMNVEFRHPDPAVLDALSATLDDLIGQACEAHGVDVINERVLDAAPVLFDHERITPEWATAGAQVLLNAVLSLANG
jgi:N-carbamoyl-L-amino-acid hydrolase